MQNQNAEKLLEKYLAGTASPAEKAWLETWYVKGQDLGDGFSQDQLLMDEAESLALLLKDIRKGKRIRLWPRLSAAASIVVLLSAGLYFYTSNKTDREKNIYLGLDKKHDIASGKNAATLTLGNGKMIVLNNVNTGLLAMQSGVKITKGEDGSLLYRSDKATQEDVQYNTLSTANGQQYKLTLPDSTKVWLNAGSSVKFPASFAGMDKRQVETKGEVYFEVRKDKLHPFVVKTGTQLVEVLGTHFNIDSYDDEKTTTTTLLEGSVKVSDQSLSNIKMLSPGQQSVLDKSTRRISVQPVDAEDEVAWKTGYFVFNDADIKDLLKSISRWYDVEIVYQEEPNEFKLIGRVSRSKNLSDVLKALELTDKIHFKVQGRRITVMK